MLFHKYKFYVRRRNKDSCSIPKNNSQKETEQCKVISLLFPTHSLYKVQPRVILKGTLCFQPSYFPK